MAEDITIAKKDLVKDLKHYNEFMGATVRHDANRPYIVIFLSKLSNAIVKRIPTEFRGNKVVHEEIGMIRPS